MQDGLVDGVVVLVPVDDVHLHGVPHVVEHVLAAPVVLVPPVEVQPLQLVLRVQSGPEDVGPLVFLLFRSIGSEFGDG